MLLHAAACRQVLARRTNARPSHRTGHRIRSGGHGNGYRGARAGTCRGTGNHDSTLRIDQGGRDLADNIDRYTSAK